MKTLELTYQANCCDWLTRLADLNDLVCFDSGLSEHYGARYDIITAEPFITIETRGEITTVKRDGEKTTSKEQPLHVLERLLTPFACEKTALPFYGGAAGYFGYELGKRFERLPNHAEDDLLIPQMRCGIYDWALVTDHQQQRSFIVSLLTQTYTQTLIESIHQRLMSAPSQASPPFKLLSKFNSNMTKEDYIQKFEQVNNYLHAGDCYQVNLAQRLTATYQGNPLRAYQKIRNQHSAAFGAYLQYQDLQILSFSPERFIQCRDRNVLTQPIKGTIARSPNSDDDKRLAEQLLNSEKDNAENLMIVDLLRNDISRCCRPESILVNALCKLQTFPNVHHLVSTVVGTLSEGQNALSLLGACFPGGSITGCPKIRAMQIIDELEPHFRGVYCGSIGYINFHGDMDTNIAIRTLQCTQSKYIHCYGGGGLVIESNAQTEYQETFDKITTFLQLLQR